MKGILTIIVSILSLLTIEAQSKLDLAINNLQQNYSQEKVYLLLDKDQYVAGDQIFFQAFVFDGYNLSSISNTLYVELYDQNKNLIDKKILLIKDAKATGTFDIAKTLDENVYFVRAYTNWMANFDNQWNFIKSIPIYNSTSKKKLVSSDVSKWTIEASTEGGTFVDQVDTKVVVRLFAQGKSPEKWKGFVVDSEFPHDKIQTFTSLDDNVALFSMTPKFGKTYQVVVDDGEGNSQITTLPTVTDQGVNLKIATEKSGLRYTIDASNLENNVQNYSIVGTINNQLAYRAKIKSGNPQISSVIPTEEIEQSGIIQISLFDEKDELVATRLCFINQNKLNANNIVVENSNFNDTPRALNSFEIRSNENSSNYTVVVKDVTDIGPHSQDNILSHLFLTQDLKNPISDPSQYFSKTAKPEALDAFLISEKWNRFDWNKVLAGQKPLIKYTLVENEYVSYKARLALNSRPLPDKLVNLVFKNSDGEPLLSQLTTDNNGDILISNLNFEDSYFVNYFLNSEEKQQPNLTLKLRPIIVMDTERLRFPETGLKLIETDDHSKLPPSVEKAFANAQIIEKLAQEATLIEEVKIVKKKSDAIKKLNKELTSGMFSSMNATIFDFVNDNQDAFAALSILEWLQGRVAGLSMVMVQPGSYMPIIRGVEAGIFLDEINVKADAVQSLSMSNIAMVKIIKGSRLIGNSILIYTRTANMRTPLSKASDINNKVEVKAYDRSVSAKVIDYSHDRYRPYKDWRQVLYWNTDLTNSTVKFYNNDEPMIRELSIIGFDRDGRLLYINQSIR